jgi:hypothetical protein
MRETWNCRGLCACQPVSWAAPCQTCKHEGQLGPPANHPHPTSACCGEAHRASWQGRELTTPASMALPVAYREQGAILSELPHAVTLPLLHNGTTLHAYGCHGYVAHTERKPGLCVDDRLPWRLTRPLHPSHTLMRSLNLQSPLPDRPCLIICVACIHVRGIHLLKGKGMIICMAHGHPWLSQSHHNIRPHTTCSRKQTVSLLASEVHRWWRSCRHGHYMVTSNWIILQAVPDLTLKKPPKRCLLCMQ